MTALVPSSMVVVSAAAYDSVSIGSNTDAGSGEPASSSGRSRRSSTHTESRPMRCASVATSVMLSAEAWSPICGNSIPIFTWAPPSVSHVRV